MLRCVNKDATMSHMKETTFTFRLTEEEKKQGMAKSGDIPLSVIIRELFQMWLNGEIEIKI